CQQYNNDPYSF
nr:immunoglobulin light chain junction region [Macaca mulatta]MOW42018.1 immunoglobulin light chain junction region [Macaca mulatta]MOW44111.1 immunoglobulin light chain junction region [Macaca mulatta]MOW44871.1 immunoglobulin light chain junction region [Macaca mulatta]